MRKPLICCWLLNSALSLAPAALSCHAAAAPFPQQSSGAPQEAEAPIADLDSPLADEVIQQVLEPLRTGIQTLDMQTVLSVFDKKEVSYPDLQGQLSAFFQQFNEVRFRYRLLQVAADKEAGSAVAEMDMDALSYDRTRIPVRRTVQMRLKLRRESKQWKIVSFSPADFFGIGYNRAEAQATR